MDTRIIVLVALMGACATASAQSVHKCVDRSGAVSYQSEPCPGKAAKTWAAAPEAAPSNAERWRRHRAKQQAEADSRYLSRLAGRARSGTATGTSIEPNRPAGDCAATKRMRDSQVTLDTGYDARRAWADAVYDACK